MDWHCVQVDLVTGGGDREAEYITAGRRLQCGPVCSVGVPTALAGWPLPQQPLEAYCAVS